VSVRSFAHGRWQRRSLAGLLGLVALAPVFAWAATQTGYAEPMDNAAELAGAASEAAPTGVSLFSGYALPGLGPHAGTLGGALVGTAVTFVAALAVGRLLAARR
jgi:cobalt/nickel transport protein